MLMTTRLIAMTMMMAIMMTIMAMMCAMMMARLSTMKTTTTATALEWFWALGHAVGHGPRLASLEPVLGSLWCANHCLPARVL